MFGVSHYKKSLFSLLLLIIDPLYHLKGNAVQQAVSQCISAVIVNEMLCGTFESTETLDMNLLITTYLYLPLLFLF